MFERSLGLRAAILVVLAVALAVPLAISPVGVQVALAASSVTVAGSFQSEVGCSGDWQPDCATTHLTYDANDDVWQGSFSIPAGTYEFKAAIDDSWTENYGAGGAANGASVSFTIGSTTVVKFYFDPDSHWITSNYTSRIVTAAGSFQSELGCSSDWSPDCLRSWLQDLDGDGTYTMTTTALPAGDYEVKAAINESWDENYGADGSLGGANITFNVPSNNAPMTFQFVGSTNTLTVEADDVTAPTVADVGIALKEGGRIHSVPITLSWSASDDVTADAALVHEIQIRRRVHGSWTDWYDVATVTGRESSTRVIATWITYQYRVRTQDEALNWSDWAQSTTVRAPIFQESDFTLSGDWHRMFSSRAMGKHFVRSSTAGATANLTFVGNGVAAVMPAGAGLGAAEICVDPATPDEDCATVDLSAFAPTGARRLVKAFNGLDWGTHVLRVTVVSGLVRLDGAATTR
ncbi:MAG: hypothetical protein ABI725_01820 [Chloroflexota bacterium]